MVLPVLAAVALGLVWLLSLAATQVRVVDAARETARAAARDDAAASADGPGPPGGARRRPDHRARGRRHRRGPGALPRCAAPAGCSASCPASTCTPRRSRPGSRGEPAPGRRPAGQRDGAGPRPGRRARRSRRCWWPRSAASSPTSAGSPRRRTSPPWRVPARCRTGRTRARPPARRRTATVPGWAGARSTARSSPSGAPRGRPGARPALEVSSRPGPGRCQRGRGRDRVAVGSAAGSAARRGRRRGGAVPSCRCRSDPWPCRSLPVLVVPVPVVPVVVVPVVVSTGASVRCSSRFSSVRSFFLVLRFALARRTPEPDQLEAHDEDQQGGGAGQEHHQRGHVDRRRRTTGRGRRCRWRARRPGCLRRAGSR